MYLSPKKKAQQLTLKQQEFRIWNKTTYTGNGGSSVYGTTPKKRRKNDVKTILFILAYLTSMKLHFV